MRNKRGTNQYKIKRDIVSIKVIRDIWMILALVAAGIIFFMLTRDPIISPCPDMGCGIHTVKAGDPVNLTPREIMLVEGLRVFGISQLQSLEHLIQKESNFNPWAVNTSSGACGMGQALPCKKMKCDLGDSECQAKWTIRYIKSRYGTPDKAWSFHQIKGWY